MPQAIVQPDQGNGARLVSVEGRDLPLKSVAVAGQAKGGLARVVLKQTYANPHAEPLKVTYTMPLPADGAVAAYEFVIGDRRVVGEIDRRARARDRFERALIEGRTAGILDQERASLFTQEIGNVPPRTEVAVELSLDQPLVWLPEGMWEWRFPTVAAPRYLGAPGRVEDAANVTVDVADGATGARASLEIVIGDLLADGRRPESPSHRLSVAGRGAATSVTFAGDGGAALDRDLVVRWAVARPRAGVTVQTARPEAGRPHASHAYGLLTVVPPETPAAVYPRDLIVLLDTSGSMTGPPLEQARRVVAALVDSLGDTDRLEMIAFSNSPSRWRTGPLEATGETRRDAHRWLAALRAGGGTEMRHALEEALRPLRPDAQRQVVLVTDGEIGFESEIVRSLCHDLPRGSRLHAAGVGACPNRALTRPAARAGRGVEVLAALDEDAERAAARLIAATRGPAIVDLEIGGAAVAGFAPRPLPDLMAGAPVLIALSLNPDGGELRVRGRTPAGPWEERLTVPPTPAGDGGPGVITLYGREAVENLELDLAAGAERDEIDRAVEKIGLEFGLATRLTSWVAISEVPNVDPRLPVRRETIPQELPYGMSAEGLGLRRHGQGTVAAIIRAAHAVSRDDLRFYHCGVVGHDGIEQEVTAKEGEASVRLRSSAGHFIIGRWAGPTEGGGQVLEFLVTGDPLNWKPAAHATVYFRMGEPAPVEVIQSATTRPGRVETGRLVRLAVRIEAEALKNFGWIEIDCGGAPLRIAAS